MNQSPRLLIIDDDDNAALRNNLEQQFGFRVDHFSGAHEVDEVEQTLRQAPPDVVVLNADLSQPSSDQLLAQMAGQQLSVPVVLIGSNGETSTPHATYPHIVGWISQSYTAAELALLIQTALERPLPASGLVLAKRAELVEANRRLSHRVQELQTLSEIGKSVTSQLELKAVLRRVTKAAVDLTEAEESYLLLLDEASGDLYLRAEANFEAGEAKDFWIKTKDSISGQVVQSGEPIILTSEQRELKVKTGLAVYSLVNVPLSIGASVIGVLGVNNRHQQRAFTKDDVKLLSMLADWAAIAIQNAKLYAETREFSRDLQLVNEVSQLVSGTLDVQQIPRLLLERAAEIVGAECGSLALIDRERNGVVFQLAHDSDGNELPGMTGMLIPLDKGIVGQVAQSGQPVIANNVRQHTAWSSLPDQLTGFITRKIIAVPLIVEGETIGVIELLNKLEGDFTENDVQLLSLIATSTASAIQNAQQYQTLKQTNRALREVQGQRIAAERWAVLGKAAATLAHRINNTTALVPIAAQHTQELLQQVEMPPELKETIEGNLGRIERNSLYTVELAELLLRRFRKQPREAHDVNRLVRRALELVEIPDNIKVLADLDPKLPDVTTSDLLADVFVELISNAVRAIGDHEGLLRIATFKAGHEKISIQVTDNGPGIPADKISQIFDMFYTTTSSGLGFGLWWVKTFLEQQGGEIKVVSVPEERSTTFTISLRCNPPSLRSL